MSEETKIQWCDSTASPWTICSKVSPGCEHCYAADLAKRYGWGDWGPGKPRHKFKGFAANCRKWNKQADQQIRSPKIFPSLCDWLDPEVPIEWLAEFLQVIFYCPNLDFLLLTKRPENWEKRIRDAQNFICKNIKSSQDTGTAFYIQVWVGAKNRSGPLVANPPSNIWLGVSIEDQQRADERIPELLKIPAKVRFLSCEPLLGPIVLPTCNGHFDCKLGPEHGDSNAFGGTDWVIVGGESGPNARPCNVEWIRSIIRQCKAASVPCFVKQLGSLPYEPVASGNATEQFISGREVTSNPSTLGVQLKLKHPKGGDPSEWPEDLRVREMPR